MATKYIVNNVSGQTINGESVQRPYKVYTALLTQIGGNSPQTISAGTLAVGVTYEITNYQPDDDFTNVGALLNETGIKFVATGTVPNVWTNNSELSYNNGAPTVMILENTIGDITWSYTQTGYYSGNLNGAFTTDKTFCQGRTSTAEDGTLFIVVTVNPSNEDSVSVFSANPLTETAFNDLLSGTPIEIRVYN